MMASLVRFKIFKVSMDRDDPGAVSTVLSDSGERWNTFPKRRTISLRGYENHVSTLFMGIPVMSLAPFPFHTATRLD